MATITKRNFLGRFNYKDAATFAEAVIAAKDSKPFAYVGSFAITELDWRIAHAIGESRRLIKDLRGRRKQGSDLGDIANEQVDTTGAMGEWLVDSALDTLKGVPLELEALVSSRSIAGATDVRLAGEKYDVKTSSEGRIYCQINQANHLEKGAAAYIIVKIAREDVADIYVVSGASVNEWRLNYGRSAYYQKALPAGNGAGASFEPLPPIDADEEAEAQEGATE